MGSQRLWFKPGLPFIFKPQALSPTTDRCAMERTRAFIYNERPAAWNC